MKFIILSTYQSLTKLKIPPFYTYLNTRSTFILLSQHYNLDQ
jgi:hypothetical protein